jgi:hypothetical protein
MARRKWQAGSGDKKRPLRRSQLISPFGVGAISDFRGDESLMCAGLDEWFGQDSDIPAYLKLEEPRLERRLGKQFFVKPPEEEGEDGRRRRIPFVRFPQWHYCPFCFRMSRATYYQDQPRCAACKPERPRRMIPVRIVAVCDHGHIQDFPFRDWIRCTCSSDAVARLFFRAGRSSAGLAGIHISCESCGKTRSLAGAMQTGMLRGVGVDCAGSRPWFGEEATRCGLDLNGVQRGGSNVYFPVVLSSIYIPDEQTGGDETLLAMLDRDNVWGPLTAVVENGKIDRSRSDMIAGFLQVDPGRFHKLAQAKLDGRQETAPETQTEEQFRQQEYALLSRSTGPASSKLVNDWIGAELYGHLRPYIRGVGLVRKLRETRVLCGFSRLEPRFGADDPQVQPLALGNPRWLPGLDVYGEGIFIEFRHDVVAAWAASAPVKARLNPPIARLDGVRASRGQLPSGAHPKLIFLHTFAHALIKELTFSCGYGSSSLRERLYVDTEHPDVRMSGVLIYTASGDADGTLGGLVAQGEPARLPRVIAEALRRATWCSNDPVCMEGGGRAPDSGSLAACHSCSLVPETSCEQGNRLLDRATLVGTLENPSVGFLAQLVPGFAPA